LTFEEKKLPTNIKQAVAMRNNEDMEVNVERGHGLQGTDDNNKSHEARRKGSQDPRRK
jgi:hypothetical protein